VFRIINKEELAKGIKRIEVEAHSVAKKAVSGQFVIIRIDEKGERIPLTIADWNRKKGVISLIFQEVGYTTQVLGRLKINDEILDLLGPLGRPTEIRRYGNVICIGGGVGIAEILPISKTFKEKGNFLIGIIGAKSKSLLILEKEMREICDKLYVTTDDGSYGSKGFVTDVLREILNLQINLVYAVGPVPMMKRVCEITRPYNIKTVVSLNPIMVDGTGMCGACRVSIGGKTKFCCVDGPEFDGHLVDFEELEKRLNLFKESESCLAKRYQT
jgi:ferredoxin--NADP+ reductase